MKNEQAPNNGMLAKYLGKNQEDLTIDDSALAVNYDPETGLFSFKEGFAPKQAFGGGFKNIEGYLIITVWPFRIRAHRLAWKIMTGEWPTKMIDHANGDRADNRWSNLREADHSQNAINRTKLNANNTSGVHGVRYLKQNGKFVAEGKLHCKTVHIGIFDRRIDAVNARRAWEIRDHGEFSPAAQGHVLK